MLHFTEGYYKIVLYKQTSYTMFAVTYCRSECCVSSAIDFKAASGSIVPYYSGSRASDYCKHDMGTLLWLKV